MGLVILHCPVGFKVSEGKAGTLRRGGNGPNSQLRISCAGLDAYHDAFKAKALSTCPVSVCSKNL